MTRLSLSAARPAAAPDRAGGERRKVQGCGGRAELSCPTSETDWRGKTSTTKRKKAQGKRLVRQKDERRSVERRKRLLKMGKSASDSS